MVNAYAPPPRGGQPRGPHKASRDWYSISVDSVRRALVFLVAVVAILGAGLGYQRWEKLTLQQRAQDVIDRAGQLSARLSQREDDSARSELATARSTLEHARSEFGNSRFEEALDLGQQALIAFETIDQGADREGPIRFQALHGSVEYRRGDHGTWRRARIKDTLHPGDWLKTSADGSAEILFPSRSVYTLRTNTMVHLGSDPSPSAGGGGEAVADIVFGGMQVNTAANGGKVTTPSAETALDRNSEAAVEVDRDRGRANFATYSGGMEVTSTTGERQRLGSLEQLDQVGTDLSAPKPLPGRPTLQRPPDSFESDFSSDKRIVLAWAPVDGAERYRLRIAREALFAETLIDTDRRTKTTATLGVRGEGSFFWQVAALGGEGIQGPWSETRSFRVVTLDGLARSGDTEPPMLEVSDIQTYGSLVLVNGRTEGGSAVTVNGEPAAVALDGSFSKAIQMAQDSWVFLEIESTDAWGNVSRARKRVFVDAF